MTQWKIVFVSGIILFSMGLPLLIVGYVSAGENAVAMLAPGAIMFGGGTFVAIVAAAMGMGLEKGQLLRGGGHGPTKKRQQYRKMVGG